MLSVLGQQTCLIWSIVDKEDYVQITSPHRIHCHFSAILMLKLRNLCKQTNPVSKISATAMRLNRKVIHSERNKANTHYIHIYMYIKCVFSAQCFTDQDSLQGQRVWCTHYIRRKRRHRFGGWFRAVGGIDVCRWVGATDKHMVAILLRIAISGHVEVISDQQQSLDVGSRLWTLHRKEVWDVHAG